jgi:hypothetical protein
MRNHLWFLLLFPLVMPLEARAEGSVSSLVEHGIQLRRDHRDAEALDAFRQAFELEASARTRAQIALAEQALGRWVDAEKDMNEALAEGHDEWIRDHAVPLSDALTAIRHHLGTLIVESNFSGAELWVNGAKAGSLPLPPVRVATGDVDYELRLAEHRLVQRRIKVAPDTTAHELVDFADARDSSNSSFAPRADGLAPHDQLLERREEVPLDPHRTTSALDVTPTLDAGAGRRAIAWGLLGGAGAFLTAAVAAHVVHAQSAAHYNDDSLCLAPGLSRDEVCGKYRGRADTAATLATIGYAGAGALAIASGVLFLVDRPRPRAGSVRVVVGGNAHGVFAECLGHL